MRKYWASQTLILLLVSNFGIAQDFRNLNFEYGIYKDQPRKWAIEGDGESYSANLDSIIKKSGKKSLYVTLKNAEVFIFLSLPAPLIAGKDVQVDGYFKSSSSDSLHAMLLFHNPSGGKPISSEPNNPQLREWQAISIQSSFPKDYSSDRLLVALTANGSGRFWLDNIRIRIDGKDYGNGGPDFREPTKSEIQALNMAATPIPFPDSNSSTTDLAALNTIVQNAKIVALGENSHGSSSIFKTKLKIIKYLVEEEGFSIFALESPSVEADKINEFVLTGKGTLKDVIRNLVYPSWQTQEMINIIQWIQTYNRTAKQKVEFRGFDMQDGTSALTAIRDFAFKNDSILLAGINELRRLYDEAKQWDQIYMKAREAKKYLESKHSSDYSGVTAFSFSQIDHYMDIFLQSISSKYQSAKTKSRDEYMAENIEWHIKHSADNSKIVISADNTHVTKATGKMGNALRKLYGDKYFVVGFTYNTGFYSAYGTEPKYEVYPSYVGTYEYYFTKCKAKNFILDLRNVQNVAILDQPSGFRSIGSRPQQTTQFAEINLRDHFDAIVYLENSINTILLSK